MIKDRNTSSIHNNPVVVSPEIVGMLKKMYYMIPTFKSTA